MSVFMLQSTICRSANSDVCTVQLPPNLTVAEAVEFEQTVKTISQEADITQVVLDFSQTRFIDSSGLGALVICRRYSQQNSWQLVLKGVQPQVKMALEMTDLKPLFTFVGADSDSDPDVVIAPETQASKPQIGSTHPSVTSRGKRALDILGSLVGLAIVAVVFAPIALAIWIDDPGPIFFRQERCSWMGKRFKIWKFRTMVVNAEALKNQVENQLEGPLFKNENDPRITRLGRFLRRTSLDELPQFWNVLVGDMSLVGTRPPTPDEIEQYKVPEWQRLNVKPGMTGEWQVNGRSQIKTFEEVIQMDLSYQEKWSLSYDIQLILKTVLVLFSKNAGAI